MLIMNRDNRDILYWHLVKTKKPSPPCGLPPLQSSTQCQAYKTMERLGRVVMCAQKHKGMHIQACVNGETIHYHFLALIGSFPLMHKKGSIYIPSIGNEGSSQSVSWHMEGQESSYSGLIEEKSKYFIFYAHLPMYVPYSGASCMYTWILR